MGLPPNARRPSGHSVHHAEQLTTLIRKLQRDGYSMWDCCRAGEAEGGNTAWQFVAPAARQADREAARSFLAVRRASTASQYTKKVQSHLRYFPFPIRPNVAALPGNSGSEVGP